MLANDQVKIKGFLEFKILFFTSNVLGCLLGFVLSGH